MPDRLRTFIAVEIEQFTRDRLVGLQERLAAGGAAAKWVERVNLHLTLLFLGEVDARETPDVCRAVSEASAEFAPFAMSIVGAVYAMTLVARPWSPVQAWNASSASRSRSTARASRVESSS